MKILVAILAVIFSINGLEFLQLAIAITITLVLFNKQTKKIEP
jgi:hypothetical protein